MIFIRQDSKVQSARRDSIPRGTVCRRRFRFSLVRFGVAGAFGPGQDAGTRGESPGGRRRFDSPLFRAFDSPPPYRSPSPLGGSPAAQIRPPACLKGGRPPAVCDAPQSHRPLHRFRRQPRSVCIGARKPMWLCVCPAPTIRTAWVAVSNNVFRCVQCTMIHTIRQATSDNVFQCMQ